MTRRPRRLGGPGDWLAPVVALLVVSGLGWLGATFIQRAGWPLPWADARVVDDSPSAASVGIAQSGQSIPDPGGAAPADATPSSRDVDVLRARGLALPVRDLERSALKSNFHEARSGGAHEAIDILAPRGTPIVAVEDGVVAKLFNSARGGLTVYQFDPTRTFSYYYAHLDAYAPGLHDGAAVTRGQVIGYVGTSGNAPPDTPHLHFTIFKLGPEGQWWRGEAIDPYLVFR